MFRIIGLLLVAMLFAFFVVWLGYYTKNYETQGRVNITQSETGYNLNVNGKPFYIVGAGGVSHFKELEQIGGNTLRTWDTTNIGAILDSALKYNLYVMVGLPMVESHHLDYFYKDKNKVKRQYEGFKSVVQRYKNHPALLMWICGNELDFPFSLRYNPFYKAFNDIIDMIHREDGNHPVTTTLVNFTRRTVYNLQIKSPRLDIISINTFGGQLKILREKLNSFRWFWNGPYIITEWGGNGYWEQEMTPWQAPLENTSTRKAEILSDIYFNNIPFEDKRMLGTCVFYWGSKQEKTHTWFSLFAPNGAKTEMINTLNNLWNNDSIEYIGPRVEFVLLNNNMGKNENILIPGTQNFAQVFFPYNNFKNVKIEWELFYEDWMQKNISLQIKPIIEKNYITKCVDNMVYFDTPLEEGPYRLFVYLYDTLGNFANANTPFYVLSNE